MLIEHAPMLLAVVVFAGIALLLVGLRGRRVNDHPACRRCGFDLAGVYPGKWACPECGRDLRRARAVRPGVRERRRLPLGLGGVMMFVSLLIGGVIGWLMLAGPTMNAHKPVFVLALEGRHAGIERSKAAADELLKRSNAGTLSDGQYALAVDTALAIQADLSSEWVKEWGDVIEAARFVGKVRDEDYDLYLRQSAVLEVMVRPRIGQGGVIPIAVGVTEWRRANSPGAQVRVWVEEVRVRGVVQEWATYGDARVALVNAERGIPLATTQTNWARSTSSADTIGLELDAPGGPGRAPVEIKLRLAAGEPPAVAVNAFAQPVWRTLEPAVTLRAESDVSPSATTVGVINPGPRYADEARAFFAKSQLEIVLTRPGPEPDEAPHAMVHLHIPRSSMPAGMAYNVTLEGGGRTYDAGEVSSGLVPRHANFGLAREGPMMTILFSVLSVDVPVDALPPAGTPWVVTFVPDPSLAERSLDLDTLLAAPVRIELTPRISN